jgi:hypothetical protein
MTIFPATVRRSIRAFTLSAAANLTRDLNFKGTISGNVYAHLLYIEDRLNGPMIIAVTESNNVYIGSASSRQLGPDGAASDLSDATPRIDHQAVEVLQTLKGVARLVPMRPAAATAAGSGAWRFQRLRSKLVSRSQHGR